MQRQNHTDVRLSTKNNTDIDSDKLIQKGDKIYVLDDPVEEYEVKFSYKPPPLMLIDISPKSGIVNQKNPTITFTFNYPVTITYADFYMEDLSVELTIIDDIVTQDYFTFSYTPPSNLKKGIYSQYHIKNIDQTKKTIIT